MQRLWHKKTQQIILACALVVMPLGLTAEAEESQRDKAIRIADEITTLRSRHAATLLEDQQAVTPPVFKQVCGPVKKRAMAIMQTEGVKIRHAAVKNRNPNNKADYREVAFQLRFSHPNAPTTLEDAVEIKGQAYYRVIQPVFVEKACLSCHGAKDKRPAFIKKKYPQDKAFDFAVGDVRGIVEVMIPVDE